MRRLNRIVSGMLGGCALIGCAAPAAQAQGPSVVELFQKYDLIGTFARDCKLPVGRDNIYYVHRILDATRVQRDAMNGPQNRVFAVILETGTAVAADRIEVTGTREGHVLTSTYRVEPGRLLIVAGTVGGKPEVADSRFMDGSPVPWAYKCG